MVFCTRVRLATHAESGAKCAPTQATEKWAARKRKTDKLHMAYNKIAKKDKLWWSIKDFMETVTCFDDSTLDALPERIQHHI